MKHKRNERMKELKKKISTAKGKSNEIEKTVLCSATAKDLSGELCLYLCICMYLYLESTPLGAGDLTCHRKVVKVVLASLHHHPPTSCFSCFFHLSAAGYQLSDTVEIN